ncbi:alanine racemase [Aliidiomarina shirensis]|uniref:Alanine racemase n=1 Tax=Aliidiomarina shirensis TaxID=1048642 RepID=A0A432WKX4_9GAMM|nr:alanine racemase [Aliidiomarina shirensis]RUO34339.1 alanine racemase [Aliidiomarina shirensis]
MADAMRPAWAAINLQALQHNTHVIRKLAGERRILGILKANAYGHGLTRIAQALADIDAIGVARVDEALQLRNAGITRPIVLLEGFFAAEQIPVLAASSIQPVIHNMHQLEQLAAAEHVSDAMRVWLKIDTGMHRLGIEPSQVSTCYQRLLDIPHVNGAPVLMSHLACADEPDHEQNRKQLTRFSEAISPYQGSVTSMANSAALFAGIGKEYDWVRPGLALYGVSPFSETIGRDYGLEAVMNLQASVISVRKIKAGEPVGYGAAWAPATDTHIGIVAIGYGDGYPRHAPEGTPVWIGGRCYPMVGRVAMDMITVDLGADLRVALGDTAQLWGRDLPVEKVAEAVGTIPYELLCNVARRVQLDYLD